MKTQLSNAKLQPRCTIPHESGTQGKLTGPDVVKQMEQRIAELEQILLTGLMGPDLAKSLDTEVRYLKKVLLAATAGDNARYTQLVSPEGHQALEKQLTNLKQLTLSATMHPDLAEAIKDQIRTLERLLTSI